MSEDFGRPYDPAKDATAQEPLTANEKKLVTRLFGDPFAFPMEYKAWLRGWMEEEFPRIGTLAASAVPGSGAAGALVPPAGAILDYGGDVAPGGYVMCNGAEYNNTLPLYTALFGAIGFKYGTGSTGNMFLVPDFQGRVAVGKGTHSDVDAMGDSDGLPVGTRSIKHSHTVSDPQHFHMSMDIIGAENIAAGTDYGTAQSRPTDPAATGITVGPAGTPVNSPAFLVVNKIISLGS